MPDPTVPDLLDARAADTPGQGVVFPDGRASYAELAVQVGRVARGLWALGVRPGDPVGLLLHGGMDSMRFWLAASAIGAVTVPLNVRLRPREIAYVISDAGLRVLVTTSAFEPVLDGAEPDTVVVLDRDADSGGCLGASTFDAAAAGTDPGGPGAARAALTADDPNLMLYTSGTTSRPRGCVHTHHSLVAEGEAVAERLQLTAEDRFWTPLPMFHCGGFDVALAALAGRCGFVHVGTFEPGRALRQLVDERCTVGFPAFETIWLPVLDHPDFASADLSALRMVINVGAPERMRSMQARLPRAVQLSCLGMTESFGFCCVGSPDDPAEVRATTSGRPLRHMEAMVVDPETGVEVAPGVPGEFRFRGGSRLSHYHRDPELTALRIDGAGWFASGDQVVADAEGRLRFLTRLGDILKVGGENVAAAEIEGFLSEHPAAGIVAVVGAPDARYGEVPAAFVQLRPGASATEAELIAFCLGAVATYKVPRYVRFVDEWPMSGTKVQKFRLRALIADELARRGVTEAPRMTAPPVRAPRVPATGQSPA
ncbi:class I adenylate-forming enzyme family protein [Pseudonocardia sp. KRD291]|uniref:class I adenylate-forming enzyme family protein n=1 Tax=Pseudonocardia sp. KRD291 TaxID=2792007 RepID=UPI001C49F47B|nr:AMP-binding protein [Pseudonocardia sp. KRD291]MBW0105042.1 AMP-binding protein [Pseudonocardia sp. KRD291]